MIDLYRDALNLSNSRVKKISKVAFLGLPTLAVLLISSACSISGEPMIKASWIDPQTTESSVSVPVIDINNKKIINFAITDTDENQLTFMAYTLDDTFYVRANVCPPCGSIGFSLDIDQLVCNTCGTVFDAKTGEGVSGGCKNFPKASVVFQNADAKLMMNANDLQIAYQNTKKPGLP